MKLVAFNAKCPFEIGDRLSIRGYEIKTITDISCIHYVKSGTVEFMYELDNSGAYIPLPTVSSISSSDLKWIKTIETAELQDIINRIRKI